MTLTTRAGSPDQIQLIYQDGTVKTHADLSPFLNTWVVATETVKVSTSGTYSIVIKTLSGGQTLLSYSNSNINMFPTQTGTGFTKPSFKPGAGSVQPVSPDSMSVKRLPPSRPRSPVKWTGRQPGVCPPSGPR